MVVRDGNTVPVLSPGTPGQLVAPESDVFFAEFFDPDAGPTQVSIKTSRMLQHNDAVYIMTYSLGNALYTGVVQFFTSTN